MLRIYCPYCKEHREEEEFSYAGEAHIKRPDNIDELDDEAFGRYLYFRKNPKGMHHEMWVHTMGCRKYFNVKRHTVTYEIFDGEALADEELSMSEKEKEGICI